MIFLELVSEIRRLIYSQGLKRRLMIGDRLLFYYSTSDTLEQTLERLEDSFYRRSHLRRSLLRLRRKHVDEDAVVKSLVRKYRCSYLDLIEGLINCDIRTSLDREVVLINEIRNRWLNDIKYSYSVKKKAKKSLLLINVIVIAINSYIAMHFDTKYAFEIFGITTTLGIIVYELLNFSCIKNYKTSYYAGNLAFINWGVNVALLSSEYSINEAIIQSYDRSPKEMRLTLKELVDSLKKNVDIHGIYSQLLKSTRSNSLYRIMTLLYENRDQKGEEISFKINDALRDYVDEIHEEEKEKIQNKTQTMIAWAKLPYETICGLGIMVNVMMILGINLG